MTVRLVTLPPGLDGREALEFARRAKAAGAEALEMRNDLHPTPPSAALSEILDILVSERGRPLNSDWTRTATWVDSEGPIYPENRTILSHHAPTPMSPTEALSFWMSKPHVQAAFIKHVEPLGDLHQAQRLLETQTRLMTLVGPGKVTVLATGPQALPFRALLARQNAFDYLALDGSFAAAPGQRLLADAVRTGQADGPRLGILGQNIGHSRSPRIHPQPFDRIDLPPDAQLSALLEALHPFYRGLAVTSPFKHAAALASRSQLAAVNTLRRSPSGWSATNTDVLGAEAVLQKLGGANVTALGDGGVGPALRTAAQKLGLQLTVVRRSESADRRLSGQLVWTWPANLEVPEGLRLDQAQVAVIAYGPSARKIATKIRQLGGNPLMLGARWFVAQARAQRKFWEAV